MQLKPRKETQAHSSPTQARLIIIQTRTFIFFFKSKGMDVFAEVKGKCIDSLSNSENISCRARPGLIRNHDKKETKDPFKTNFLYLQPEDADNTCPIGLTLDFLHLKAASVTKTPAKPSSLKLDIQKAETKRNYAFMPHNCSYFFQSSIPQSQVCWNLNRFLKMAAIHLEINGFCRLRIQLPISLLVYSI